MLKSKVKSRKNEGSAKARGQYASGTPNTQKVLKLLETTTSPILLAGSCLSDLPVTIPVNLAVSLSNKKKCLLIDFDNKRDALAKVFEVNSTKIARDLKVGPIQTEFNNLSVWPAQYFNLLKQMDLDSLLNTANKKYDHILLYAPYLPVLTDRKYIAFRSKQAIVFCKGTEQDTQLRDLLKKCNCKILLEA